MLKKPEQFATFKSLVNNCPFLATLPNKCKDSTRTRRVFHNMTIEPGVGEEKKIRIRSYPIFTKDQLYELAEGYDQRGLKLVSADLMWRNGQEYWFTKNRVMYHESNSLVIDYQDKEVDGDEFCKLKPEGIFYVHRHICLLDVRYDERYYEEQLPKRISIHMSTDALEPQFNN